MRRWRRRRSACMGPRPCCRRALLRLPRPRHAWPPRPSPAPCRPPPPRPRPWPQALPASKPCATPWPASPAAACARLRRRSSSPMALPAARLWPLARRRALMRTVRASPSWAHPANCWIGCWPASASREPKIFTSPISCPGGHRAIARRRMLKCSFFCPSSGGISPWPGPNFWSCWAARRPRRCWAGAMVSPACVANGTKS